jgi:hypothetical protein
MNGSIRFVYATASASHPPGVTSRLEHSKIRLDVENWGGVEYVDATHLKTTSASGKQLYLCESDGIRAPGRTSREDVVWTVI